MTDTTDLTAAIVPGAFQPPTTTDESQIHAEMVTAVQAEIPTWAEVDGSLDNQILWAGAQVEAETRDELQTNLQAGIISLLGAYFHIPQQAAVAATGSVTVTAIDTLGHTLAAGTSMFLGDLELQTLDDLVISPGSTSGDIGLWAIVPGANANGSTGDLTMDAVQDTLGRSWIDSVSLDSPLSGGVDEEPLLTYGYRLAATLPTLGVRALPVDFAILATQTDGIEIAWAINGYNPSDGTSGNAGTICVICAAADGSAPSNETLAAAQAVATANTLLCTEVFVVAVTHVAINVAATVNAQPGWADDDVEAQAVALITSALNPGVYAAPQLNVAPTPPPAKLYANDLIADVKNGAQSVLHVTSLTVNGGASVTFTVGQLPTPGTIAVTVV